jgi:hypothetical protein
LEIGFRQLLDWLRRAEMTSICVIDNASTYPPLLDFYESAAMNGIQLIRVGNLGYEAIWRLGLHHIGTRYIYTDADIVPDKDCPLDLVRKMHEIADRYRPAKVGPAIRVDDLPECFSQAQHMKNCEADYWIRKHDAECWDALIDTTFALYESGWERWPQVTHGAKHIRLDFPYVVQHIPWYEDSSNPTAEARYYRAHVAPGYSSSCPVPIPE